MNKIKLSKFKIAVLLILFLAAFLRFYNLPNLFIFAGDEEYQAYLAQSLIKHFHIIWIGVNAAHLGFYLGPFWAYFTAFWLKLSAGNPQITGYVSSFIGVITCLAVILAGSRLFNKKVGLLAGLLYASLPLVVFFDQKYWNPTLVPLLSVGLLFSVAKLKQNPRFLILFGICSGLTFHTHLSLIPEILVGLFWIIKQKVVFPKKILLTSAVLFIMIISPLLAFDYFHKGSNITTPLRINQITSAPENHVNPSHHLIALFQTLGRIWYLRPPTNNADEVIVSCARSSRTDTKPILDQISARFNPPLWLSIFGLLLLVSFLIYPSTRKKDNHLLLALFLLSVIFSFIFFPGGAFEYYLLSIFPLLLFIPGILCSYYPKLNRTIILLTFLSSIMGVYTVITNNPIFGFNTKQNLVKQVIQIIDDQPFELKQTGLCHFYEAWRYLFILNGKSPQRSDSDLGLGWLYSSQISQQPITYRVIMSEDRVPINQNISGALILHSGGFTAYIFRDKIR